MRFLIKLTLILGLLVWFVPLDDDKTQKSNFSQAATALETLATANAVWSDAENFCNRQPQACALGASAAQTFSEKAAKGARMVSQYLEKNTQETKVEKKTSTASTKIAHKD